MPRSRLPGVVCLTSLAWLLAVWSGNQYVNLCQGGPDRYPLLGPALIGSLLGMDQGILFILVSYLGMPTETPAEG